ncbi:MAG TPA: glycosyltransferase [Novosphingobium sp.]|nr:glycosyltransferase [Novosphingobium sp.]HMP56174.1 glycosyltransferase [Novosphingobium sp.]
MLHHTLISRFNLATPGREVGFRSRPGWLEERFALFERYCLPSVAAQTCQAFDWIVFFDDQTPDWARDLARQLQAVRPFHALYTPLFDNDGWARAVRTTAGPPVPGRLLVTSNLDNDDALGFDYVERVQQAARQHFSGARFAVNLPDGYVLADRALYAHRHVQNAFTNLVEPDDEAFTTTMTIRHMELADHVPVIQAHGAAGWLQVVHGGNVSNRVRGRRVGGVEARRCFPAEVLGDIAEPSLAARLTETLLAAPARALRDRAFALARRIVPVDRG